jgi:hypothetical protein
MRAKVCLAALAAVWVGVVLSATPAQYAPANVKGVPTFTKDVAPVLYENCTSCHRPGEIAPMSLLTYEEARPWAKAIRDEVSEGHMPPWHAEAPHGTFLNERRLTEAQKDVLVRWASNGAPKGDPKDLPPAPEYATGWSIGKPDAVFEMQEDYKIPADGVVNYEYFYIPTNFTEPKFVQAIEVRPGTRSVVHHVLVYYRARPDQQRTPVLRLNEDQMRTPARTPGTRAPRRELGPQRLLATYAPGTQPQTFRPGTALRLEAGGVLELQMHYTTNGEAASDRTKIGLVFSKEASPREVRPSHFFNGTLSLPAGAADVRVDADVSFVADATLWGIFPHTHLRGKKWSYVLELPDGTKKTILDVPRYDFNWQTYYLFKEPLHIPKGSRIVSSAWYDNSAKNPANPDPTMAVTWGDQTWEEMQYTGILFSPAVPSGSASQPSKASGGR